MLNLDFHNLLNADEFVHFVRDVLEIRERGLTFTSYKRGPDRGIDIRCTNSDKKIIGQVKLYDPGNFQSLMSSLRGEVEKCKKIQPARYILCVGCSLNPQQASEILELFEGYICCEEDIIDGIKLNKYINQPDYERLKEVYSTLLVPDLSYVVHIIDQVVNRRILNNTEELLAKIRDRHSLYCNTSHYRNALKKLNRDRIVIITGNPGVGKTTTAEMIIQQLLVRNWDYVYKLEQISDIRDVFLRNKKQLFFVDDFWGSQFEKGFTNRDYLKRFVETVEMLHRSEQHYLIMTSRTYIIQSVLNSAEDDVERVLDINNYTIQLEDYSQEDKAKIFLNHLLFYNCNRDFFDYLRYGDELEMIVDHENYSPRHIEYFLKYIYTEDMDEYDFYRSFKKYLRKPYEFWKKVLNLQSDTARLILLLLLVSSDPIRKEDLKATLKRVSSFIKAELNFDIQLLKFEDELRTLEDLFIRCDEKYSGCEVWIEFSSPGIKDYVLEYLKNTIDLWGAPLIRGACFFNQLYYVFDTKKKEFADSGSEKPLRGEKIVLSPCLQMILKDKVLREFEELNFSIGLFSEVADSLCYEHNSEDTEYYKFLVLCNLFDIEEHIDVRNFIIDRVKYDIQLNDKKEKIAATESMLRFPYVIKRLKPYLDVDPADIIAVFHRSISFAAEYHYFYSFKEIFPSEFQAYYVAHIREFRNHIRKLIVRDIKFYSDNENIDWELDVFIEVYIEELQKEFGIRLNKKLIQDVEYYTGIKLYGQDNNSPKKFRLQKQKKRAKEIPRKVSLSEKIVSLYVDEPGVKILEPEKYIKKNGLTNELKQQLLVEIKKKGTPVSEFLYTSHSILALMEYLSINPVDLESISECRLLEQFVRYHFICQKEAIPPDKLMDFFMHLALEYFSRGGFVRETVYYTDSQLQQWLKERCIECTDLSCLYPFLVKRKKWYTFLNSGLILYFTAKALVKVKDPGKYNRIISDISEGETKIYAFMDEADHKRFREEILYYEIRRFMDIMNVNSNRELVLSFLKFFNQEIGLLWKKKNNSFEMEVEGGAECVVESLIQYLGVDFEALGVAIFFDIDYYWGDNIKKYKMHRECYVELYNRLLMIFHLVDENGKLAKPTDKSFSLNLYQFAGNVDNYRLLKKIGVEDYILGIYEEIQEKLKKLPDYYKIVE